jgi:hypothetical protein
VLPGVSHPQVLRVRRAGHCQSANRADDHRVFRAYIKRPRGWTGPCSSYILDMSYIVLSLGLHHPSEMPCHDRLAHIPASGGLHFQFLAQLWPAGAIAYTAARTPRARWRGERGSRPPREGSSRLPVRCPPSRAGGDRGSIGVPLLWPARQSGGMRPPAHRTKRPCRNRVPNGARRAHNHQKG